MKYTIRPARPTDMDSIYLTGIDVWGDDSSEERYLNECRTSTKYQKGQWYCLECNSCLISSLVVYTLVMHKISAQNRFAASIAASKALYSYFLDLT